VNKTNKIYDFFVDCGWMRSDPAVVAEGGGGETA